MKAMGHMTHLRACAQPYDPGSGSRGQLFRPC